MALARVIISITILFLCSSADAFAERRVALVIGNSNYVNVTRLPNPEKDASAIAAALSRLGFEVTHRDNLGVDAMRKALAVFEDKANGADWALVYYAGHGMELDGKNWLIPTDAILAKSSDIPDEAVQLERVLERVRPARSLRIVILDACRNNPFLSRMIVGRGATRSVSHGLAAIQPQSGEVVFYAARDGYIARDGDGAHSPFAQAMLKYLEKPGLELNFFFREVTSDVLEATAPDKQEPFVYGSLPRQQYYFKTPETQPSNEMSKLKEQLTRLEAELQKRQQTALATPHAKPSVAPDDGCAAGLLVSVGLSNARPCVKPGSGESFRDCADCPEMVLAPAGSFAMGSPKNEPERSDYEGPQHKVTIIKPFAVGKFAVTFVEWDACVADGGCDGNNKPSDQGWGAGEHPVSVRWSNINDYVQWLSQKTSKSYRLLSESEREYVTRAGTLTPFWWGLPITPDQANYDGNNIYKGGGTKGEYRQKTLPVQSFKPNPWGLYQVHGNIWEWVEDCWHDNYNGAPGDGSAWTTGDCRFRVIRCGSWDDLPKTVRSANRTWAVTVSNPGPNLNFAGFRVARTITP